MILASIGTCTCNYKQMHRDDIYDSTDLQLNLKEQMIVHEAYKGQYIIVSRHSDSELQLITNGICFDGIGNSAFSQALVPLHISLPYPTISGHNTSICLHHVF